MAEFKFSCPSCGQHIAATEAYSGVQIACPACQKPLTVPGMPVAPARPAAPQVAPAAAPQRPVPAPAPAPVSAKKSGAKWAIIGAVAAVVLIGAAAAFFFLKPKSDDDSSGTSDKKSAPVKEAKAGQSSKNSAGATEVMQKVSALYESMTSYSASGKSVSVIDMSKVDLGKLPGMDKLPASQRNSKEMKAAMSKPQTLEVQFKIKLAKPNLYRVDWNQQTGAMTSKGAVWSAGDGDYLLMSPMNQTKYTKMENQEMALGAATGISGGVAGTMPEIFFKSDMSLPALFKTPSLGEDENIDGDDCFVVTGKVMGLKTILWISKSTYLIKQKQQVLGGELEMSSQDDKKMQDGLKALGPKSPSAKEAKAMMNNAKAMVAKMKGTMTETYENIEFNKPIPAEDFKYPVPAGTKLSSSLF